MSMNSHPGVYHEYLSILMSTLCKGRSVCRGASTSSAIAVCMYTLQVRIFQDSLSSGWISRLILSSYVHSVLHTLFCRAMSKKLNGNLICNVLLYFGVRDARAQPMRASVSVAPPRATGFLIAAPDSVSGVESDCVCLWVVVISCIGCACPAVGLSIAACPAVSVSRTLACRSFGVKVCAVCDCV